MNRIENVKYLFYLPSFYGLISLSSTYFIYNLQIIDFGPLSLMSHVIILFSILAFLISTFFYYKLYKSTLRNISIESTFYSKIKLSLLYFIGFIGVILFLREYFEFYGGATNYFFVLFSESSTELRINSIIASESIGIQLTYLGWIALGLNTVYFVKNKISKLWLIPFCLTFLSNLLFIDRTRPMWLILIIVLIILALKVNVFTLKRLVKGLIITIIIFLVLFLAIGKLAGKSNEEKLYRGWDVSSNTQNVVFYLTSSFHYLDYIINKKEPAYQFDRTIYPALKTLNLAGFIENQPTSLINEFYGSPYQTNVGTFLEPFYNDYGIPYMLFGIILHSFFLNYIAIFFFKRKNAFSMFVAVNICIVDFFIFFTPKINNFPVWLFLFLGYILFFKTLIFRSLNVKKTYINLH